MSWLLAFAGFALLVILHELGHFMAAKAVGMRVERFSLFFPPTLARIKRGETEYAIGSIPLGGYVKISGMNPDENLPDEVRTRAYWSQKPWKRIVVIAAGPAMNVLIAILLLVAFFWFIGRPLAVVDHVDKSFPAYGKLQHADRLVAVDGHAGGPKANGDRIAAHKCAGKPVQGCRATTPARLLVERHGQRILITITPVYDSKVGKTRIGFVFGDGPRKSEALGSAIDDAANQFWFVTKATVELPGRLFNPQQRKEISSTVGAYEVTRQTILHDTANVVPILAIISLSLAIINLFPFLPLDGGHIFWAVVEKIRGRPIPFSIMERSGVVGFALILMIFAIGLTNDIGRLTGNGFSVR
ncbi:MAG: M50 family metallopeptidase [Thermoleophilaceae bacterium]